MAERLLHHMDGRAPIHGVGRVGVSAPVHRKRRRQSGPSCRLLDDWEMLAKAGWGGWPVLKIRRFELVRLTLGTAKLGSEVGNLEADSEFPVCRLD